MLKHLVIHETIIKSNYVLCSYGLVCKTKAPMAGSSRADSRYRCVIVDIAGTTSSNIKQKAASSEREWQKTNEIEASSV